MLDIDFKSGKVIHNEFNIDFSEPLKLQVYNLTQDLLQVEYKNNYILDIGWYPDFDINGSFNIYIIKDYNWENYIYRMQCKDEENLKYYINQAIEYLEKSKPLV